MSYLACHVCGRSWENAKGDPPCGHSRSSDPIVDCAGLFPRMTADFAITKVVEEIGEVADAQIGMSGLNERKGVYATSEDLRKELLDVGLTALIAWVKNEGAGDPLDALVLHALDRAARHRAEVGSAGTT